MSANKLQAKVPELAHPDIFKDPTRTLLTAEGKALLTYDPGTRSGFIYEIESGVWFIQAPVDFLQFALVARMSGHTITDSEDARLWIQSCSGAMTAHVASSRPCGTRH